MQRSHIPAAGLLLVMLATTIAISGSNNTSAERGSYIVNRVSMCTDCHTPSGPGGKPDLKRRLGGAPVMFKPTMEIPGWKSHAPNLTPGGFLKGWTDARLVKFLMTGVTPEGDRAGPPMPAYRLDERDAKAVASYLRCLPPVKGP